jgi:hypothetical protein
VRPLRRLRLHPGTICVVVALSVSCQKFAEGRQMFQELLALRDQIMSEFHERVVDVNIANGNRLTVKFIDSPLSSHSRQEKQQRADAVAAFVARHYKRSLSSVSTQFVTQSGNGETYIGNPAPKR